MLMKTTTGLRLQNDKKGMASFLITMFIMIILGLIVLGFAQISRRDQRQSLDRQLSTQAYYAAETGINDAVKHLETIPNYQKTDCTKDASGHLIPGYNPVLDVSANVAYSCVLINSTPTTIERQGVAFNSNAVFPIQLSSGLPITQIKIEWRDQNPTSTAVGCPGAGTFPATWPASCKIGLLRADLLPYGTTSSPTSDNLINNLYTVYATPGAGPGTAAYVVSTDGPRTALGNCSVGPPANCSLTIATALASANRFYVRLNTVYGISNITISANGGGPGNELIGGQAIIDSTGRANDVIKRVQVRIATKGSENIAGFALQTANSQCKRLGIEPTNDKAYIIDPGAPNNICDPSSSSISGP